MFLLGQRIRQRNSWENEQRNSWENEVLLMIIEEDSIPSFGKGKQSTGKITIVKPKFEIQI
jgi:hypothetical protein